MAFVGGALGLVAMIRGGAVRRTFVNLYLMWQTVRNKIFARGERDEDGFWVTLDTPGAITVPYGIAISAGALYAWFF
jgi:hypothetical protein